MKGLVSNVLSLFAPAYCFLQYAGVCAYVVKCSLQAVQADLEGCASNAIRRHLLFHADKEDSFG